MIRKIIVLKKARLSGLGQGDYDGWDFEATQTEAEKQDYLKKSEEAASTKLKTVASSYSGDSIADYLEKTGRGSSFRNRADLYKQYGFTDYYTGSYLQNSKLLAAIKKDDMSGGKKDIRTYHDYEYKSDYMPANYGAKTQTIIAVPAFTGSILEKLNQLLSYLEEQSKTEKYLNLSKEDKESVHEKFIEGAAVLQEKYYKENYDKIDLLPQRLLQAGKVDQVQRAQELRKQMQLFLSARIENGGAGEGGSLLGMSKLTKTLLSLFISASIGSAITLYFCYDYIKAAKVTTTELEKLQNDAKDLEKVVSDISKTQLKDSQNRRYYQRY